MTDSVEALTLHDLMTNPAGKHTRHVGARYMIRDAITLKYKASIVDPATRKRYKVSVSLDGKNKRSFIIWVKVPSEKYSLNYDVILRVTFDEGVRSLNHAQIQLYCNSPGWVMTSGYVAATQGLLIPAWKKALGRAATEAPKITNPHAEYGYDKTTFRAFLFITGAAGLITINDLQASLGGQVPDPRDPSLSMEAKFLEYERAKAKYTATANALKIAEKKTAEIERKKEIAKSRNKRDSAKSANTIAATRRTRQAGNGSKKKK